MDIVLRMLTIILLSFLFILPICEGANLAIRIPGDVSQRDGFYRLDYWPPQGLPPPNTTFKASDISNTIEFRQGLPGTRYEFRLFFSNGTIGDWLTWKAGITTAPDPPSDVQVKVRGGKMATINWNQPFQGGYSGYKIKVYPLSEATTSVRTLLVSDDASPFTLRDLTPGGSYKIELNTVFENKDSINMVTRNFTTRPNTPGRFIVWFRNETTLLVLWQPPYPPGVYSNYKVSIDPPDAIESTLDVEKMGEPPGPAQAAFYGLLPGRAYNISVQTVSQNEISQPTTAQYRTIPQRPRNVTFDKRLITYDSFQVRWEEPKGPSEFDRYHVSIGTGRQQPIIIPRNELRIAEFTEGLEPGRTYQVLVKSLSGNVASWPASANITTRPQPVLNLNTSEADDLMISWRPDPTSFQESFKVSYEELETPSGDSSTYNVFESQILLDTLLPGRNYSISVTAVSNGMESEERSLFQATRPSPPIIEASTPIIGGMNISWKSDVNSKQDEFAVVYSRNDTGEMVTIHVDMPRIALQSLFPGAGYDIKVFAISHGLWSEPHVYFQAVYPNPPRNVTIQRASNNSMTLTWVPPAASLFTNYIIKYHVAESSLPVKKEVTISNLIELNDLTPGERYIFAVNTRSYLVESPSPQILEYTLKPNPILRLLPILDSENITLEWMRPAGRVDTYRLFWYEKHSAFAPNRRIKEIDGSATSASIDGLTPGELYTFELLTVAHDVPSQKVTIDTRTMPLMTSVVSIANNREENSLTVVYTATPSSISKFDSYRFLLSDPAIPAKEKSADDTERKVVFEQLVPGRLYNITIWTVSGGVTSKPLHRQERLHPEPITIIRATKIEDTEITITWDIPPGDYDAFEVQYNDERLYQSITTEDSISFTSLKPHKNYTFTIVVRSGANNNVLRKSVPVSESFTTLESTPGKVTNFRPVDVQPQEIKFEWALPSDDQNGILVGYRITYSLKGSNVSFAKEFGPGEGYGVITKLIPGKTYVFLMQARTKVGYGVATEWEESMPIWAPPRPLSSHVPVQLAKTTTTISIKFDRKFFNDAHGQVHNYTIIVAEDDSKESLFLNLPKWRDVQSFSIWPPYQVTEPFPAFERSSIENFTVGSEVCQGVTGYCNGPLKPGTAYRMKIRAFTTRTKFTDTGYSIPIRTDSDNTAVVLGILIPLMLLIMLVVFVVLIRQRQCPAGCLSKNKSVRHADGLSMADSIIPSSRPVKLKDFAEHYRIMSADSDFRFSIEYEELKNVGRDQPCIAADLPCNRPKNRFTNILPYDHSRLKLQPTDDEEGSDYINANYVPGFNSKREFIVTQGPLHSTRDDFWRMCWESGTRAIVMLTRCVEKGREKCDRYWPYDMEPVLYGDIQVVILNESHFPDWTISEFRMSRGDVSRVVRHFHFTTWPDFGVPEPPTTLVRFVRAFRDRVGPESKPIVVHCSAGVGRSGTLIALDRGLQHIRVHDYLDIYGVVYEMRLERGYMVQTEQQYVCIYQCILSVLEGRVNDQEPPLQPLTPRELHDNHAYEDDEGIAESGM